MRTFRIVAFWAILAALIGSLIIYGKCQAHPVYDERGMVVGCTTEEHTVVEGPTLSPLGALGENIIPTLSRQYPDIITLLRECLEYIQDGSVDQGVSVTTLVYRPLTRDGVAQDEAERCRRETELHKKIVAMIEKLEEKK